MSAEKTMRSMLGVCALAGALAYAGAASAQERPADEGAQADRAGQDAQATDNADQDAPLGGHYERRPNGYLITAGAMIFGAAYLPFTIDGIYQATVDHPNQHEAVSFWYAVPIAGPLIVNSAANARNVDKCPAVMAMAPMTDVTNAFNVGGTSVCYDNNAVARNAGQQLPFDLVPRQAGIGDWVWGSALAVTEAVGVGFLIWGIIGNTVLVHDHPNEHASANEHRTHATRAHRAAPRSRAVQWAVAPGVPGSQAVGLTLTGVNF